MTLRSSYSLIAPIYDPLVGPVSRRVRINSLKHLSEVIGKQVLIGGIGTGLDIPLLPKGARYTGVDLTPAMLRRARQRASQSGLSIELVEGDIMALDFPEDCFDIVIMHLILAVVPKPRKALTEAVRVVKPGGSILVLDKFLRPGQSAPLRRLMNPLLSRIATRTDVVFEDIIATCTNLQVCEDRPAFAWGWFRHILLEKTP